MIVPSFLVGDVWPAAEPGRSRDDYGFATMSPTGRFPARSFQTLTLTYTCGRYGLDDTGGIRVVQRFTADGGPLQMTDPTAPNYVTAKSSNGAPLKLSFEEAGFLRPWFRALRIRVDGGYLAVGDTISIVLGDRTGGSPGLKLPSFCETAHEFKVVADVIATGHFVEVNGDMAIEVCPGDPVRWRAMMPTLRRPDETFHVGIKAEDLWGNPSDRVDRTLALSATVPVEGLPSTLSFPLGDRSVLLEGLSCGSPGTLVISVSDAGTGELLCETNPLVVAAGENATYWADLHGQSGETVGVNTVEEYFNFARQFAFLDATAHQANDFQVNAALWDKINTVAADFQADGRFVTFPGYEWSGNTAVGGDHNVYFRTEGRPIVRSSHALLTDRSDVDTDAATLTDLYAALKDEDCVIYAHVGGRYANIAFDHDPQLETAMEIHSAWGTFEWLLTDALALGHRPGVVCNSDGHKGRPGSSYPGAAGFGAYGGLTCFFADGLTRDSIMGSQRLRRHYGTTGGRLHLDVRAEVVDGQILPRDGSAPDAPGPVTALMGDVVATSATSVPLSVQVVSGSPIHRIDVLNGEACVATLWGHGEDEIGGRVRVMLSGALYRGRGRQTRWAGSVAFSGNTVERLEQIQVYNHERPIVLKQPDLVTFDLVTSGNHLGFDAWLSEGASGEMTVSTNVVGGGIAVGEIGREDTVLDAGGLERKISICRLPDVAGAAELNETVTVALNPERDTPIWLRVVTLDGHRAWSSPIYLVPRP